LLNNRANSRAARSAYADQQRAEAEARRQREEDLAYRTQRDAEDTRRYEQDRADDIAAREAAMAQANARRGANNAFRRGMLQRQGRGLGALGGGGRPPTLGGLGGNY
jgi:hypothetical protein